MVEQLRRFLFETTQRAGTILKNRLGRVEQISTKTGEIDLVTIADRESEELIKSAIREEYPDHSILAEESGGEYPNDSEYLWVIDPLDGTTNFAHSFPVFSVSIALQREGKTILGAVYNPLYEEFFFAERSGGSFFNDRPIRVSKVKTLDQSLLVTGFSYDRRERADHYLGIFKAFMMRCHGVRRLGSAALDFCSVACGRLEGYWEENLKPWDTAAGWLILEEAGGCVTDFSGGPYSIDKKQVLATNGHIHEEVLGVFQSLFPGGIKKDGL